ncbi:MAG: HpsJ family protein [Lyngbya sp. HA4199-MV5]|jgi:cell division protein FtsL|nr:HpsJ family protein [Lyngbya sp. HA4199-MV5]
MAESTTENRSAESTTENRSIHRFRWVGYGLLGFAFMDLVQVLYPPKFLNPAWEVQAIGSLIERVIVPLLGFALVFFGEFYDRNRVEKVLLKVLSWLCLVLAIVCLLVIPLGVFGTARLDFQNDQQINRQAEQQLSQFNKLEQQLNQSSTGDLQALAAKAGIPIDPTKDPQAMKAEMLARLTAVRAKVQSQIEANRATQKQTLFKNSIKWNLGALLSSCLFFVLWKSSDWARQR